MIDDVARWIGSHWGRTDDALVCDSCGWECPDDGTYEGDKCPRCGSELAVALENGMEWELRYLCWKHDQGWWPQKWYEMSDNNVQYWSWLGRRWRIRSWQGL